MLCLIVLDSFVDVGVGEEGCVALYDLEGERGKREEGINRLAPLGAGYQTLQNI